MLPGVTFNVFNSFFTGYDFKKLLYSYPNTLLSRCQRDSTVAERLHWFAGPIRPLDILSSCHKYLTLRTEWLVILLILVCFVLLIISEFCHSSIYLRTVHIQSTLYSRVVQTCGSGTKIGSLGQNFCIHFVLSYF